MNIINRPLLIKKHLSPLLVFVIFIVSFFAFLAYKTVITKAASTNNDSLYLTQASGSYQIGSTFTLDLMENSNSDAINAVEANLNYNPSQLQYVTEENGPPVNSQFGGPLSVFTPGSANLGFAISSNDGIPADSNLTTTGTQLVATIEFKVLASGSTTISFGSGSAMIVPPGGANVWDGNTTGGTYNLTSNLSDSISSPTNDSTVSGNVIVSAAATDSAGATVTSLALSVDLSSAPIATAPSASYSFNWNSATVANGVHTLTVTAHDSSGNSTSTSINVITNNSPTVPGTPSTTSPTNSTSPTWTWAASTDSGVGLATTPYTLQWSQSSTFASGNSTATSTTNSYSTTGLSNGTWYLEVKATDSAGNSSAYSPVGSVVVDTTKPTVNITAPANNTNVAGTVPISANISDGLSLSQVELYIDGSVVSNNLPSPYNYTWNTTSLTNGTHNILFYVVDTAGNTNSAQVSVTVNNSPIVPSTPVIQTATASAYNQVNLTWSASTDSVGGIGYYVYRLNPGSSNYTNLTPAGITSTSYTDNSVAASNTYSYEIEAYDGDANPSLLSAASSVTTPANPDTVPPTTPVIQTVTAVSSSQIDLTWSASTSTIGVAGYNVYYVGSSTPINGSSLIATTSYGVTGLSPSTNYNFYVEGVSNSGVSSAASNSGGNKTPPLISFTLSSPTNNATVSGSVPVTGSVADNTGGTITKVVLAIDGTTNTALSNPASPYALNWNSEAVANGTHNLTVTAYDSNGNSTSSTLSVTVNNAPPTVPGTPSTTSPTNSTSPTWTWAASTDSGVGLATTPYTLQWSQSSTFASGNSTATSTTNSYSTTGLSNGTWYLEVKATDSAGNSSAYSPVGSVVVDTVAPTVPGTPSTTSPTNSTSPTWTWAASTDSGVGLATTPYTLQWSQSSTFASGNSTATSTTNSYSTTGLSNGTWYLEVKATDSAGNSSAYSPVGSVVVDTVAPTVPGTPSTTSPTNSTSPTWTWAASTDSGVGLATTPYTLQWSQSSTFASGNSTATSTTNSYSTTGLSNGTWYLEVKATDSAGNSSAYSPVGSVVVDTTKPTVNITAPANNTNVAGTVPISANISDGLSLSQVELYIDGSVVSNNLPSPYNYTWNTTSLTNGTHNILFYVVDTAGNTNSAQVSVTVNNSPIVPSTPVIQTATASAYNQVNLTWSASTDSVGGIGYYVYRLNPGSSNYTNLTPAGITSTSYTDNSVAASNTYSYEIEAYDGDANPSLLSAASSVTTPANPDTVPPTTPVIQTVTAVSSSQIDLTWSASTSTIGVAGYNVYYVGSSTPINGSSLIATTSYGVTGLSPSTNYNFYVEGVSNSGVSSAASNSGGNKTPPLISFTLSSPTNNATVSGSVPVTGSVADNTGGTITKVVLAIDGTTNTALSNPASPYALNWNSEAVANGTHNLTVTAYDSSGNSTSTSINVITNNSPTVPGTPSTTSPTNSTSPTWTWAASTDSGVGLATTPYTLQWSQSSTFASGNSTATSTTNSYSTTGLSNGTWYLEVKATDSAGNSSAYSPVGSVVVDTTKPTVNITAPANNTNVAGTVPISANISDGLSLSQVELYIDGSVVSNNLPSPYNYTWNTTSLTNGTHNILFYVVDTAGNTNSAQVSVTVNNSPIVPSTPVIQTATASAYNQVNLTWSASTDSVGGIGYYVYRLNPGSSNYTNLTPAGITSTSYTDNSVAASNTYSYEIEAYDGDANPSLLSAASSVTTPANPDTVPPTTPVIQTVTAVSSSQIDLTWSASTSTIGVAGYNVYYVGSSTPINGSSLIATTSYGVTGLSPSTNYNFYVEGVSNSGVSSAASNSGGNKTLAVQNTTTVEGTVTSKTTGQPIDGVFVHTGNSGSASGQAYTYTAPNGKYMLVDLIPKRVHSYSFSATGYKTIDPSHNYPAGVITLNEALTPKGKTL